MNAMHAEPYGAAAATNLDRPYSKKYLQMGLPMDEPAVNVWVDDTTVRVETALPGVAPSNITVSLVGRGLRIEGYRKPGAWEMPELRSGRFSRLVYLPVNVKNEPIEPRLKNGVLIIRLARDCSGELSEANKRTTAENRALEAPLPRMATIPVILQKADLDPGKASERPGIYFVPHANLTEQDEEIVVTAELPGVRAKDIGLTFRWGELAINAPVAFYARAGEIECNEYKECDYFRVFPIREVIDRGHIHAECTNGVLTVHLPKIEKHARRN